MTVNIITCERI